MPTRPSPVDRYNKVLRAIGKETKRKQLMELTLGEHYVTTLHVVNSAVVKMGKVQKATKVYRGIKGGVLPAEFWTANDLGVRGGVERGFMSTTLDRDVALSYATGGSSFREEWRAPHAQHGHNTKVATFGEAIGWPPCSFGCV